MVSKIVSNENFSVHSFIGIQPVLPLSIFHGWFPLRGNFPDQEDPLEKEMATLSSIPAWKIPWTEEPGRLQSRGVAKSRTQLKRLHLFSQCS